jgi:Tfp pilus assembly protein PilO
MQAFNLSPMEIFIWSMIAAAVLLLIILVLSVAFRPLLFCQYLNNMAGYKLKPKEVRKAYKRNKKRGVRELFMEQYFKADLADSKKELDELQKSAQDGE